MPVSFAIQETVSKTAAATTLPEGIQDPDFDEHLFKIQVKSV